MRRLSELVCPFVFWGFVCLYSFAIILSIVFVRLTELMKEFLKIYEKCPSRLKKLITVRMAAQQQQVSIK